MASDVSGRSAPNRTLTDWETAIRAQPLHTGPSGGKTPPSSDAPYEALIHILWRRRFYPLAATAGFGFLALLYILFATPIYTSQSRLSVQPVRLTPTQQLGNESAPIVSENYLNTQAELITATPTLIIATQQPGIKELKILRDVENRLAYLKKNVRVEVGKKNDLITVSFDSPNRAEGTMLVKAIVNAYINYQAGKMKESTTAVLDILRKEMAYLNTQLDAKSAELAKFRRENDVLSLGDDKDNLVRERLNRLSEALTAADVEVLNAKSAFETAAASYKSDPKRVERLNAQGDQPAVVSIDEANLRTEMFALQTRLRDVQRQYLPNHPIVKNLQNRMDQMELAYYNLMDQKYKSAIQKREDLQASVNELRKSVLNQSEKAVIYSRLASDVKRLEDLSRQLDDKIKTANITENAGALNITVHDEAETSEQPTKPNKKVVLAGSLFIGLMLGLLAAFVREFTDRSLKSAGELEKVLGVPVLGAVPLMPRQYAPSTHARAVHLNPGSESAEAYRSLRAAVMLNAGPRKFKTFMVTSPLDTDGKTTVACNLAIALAKEGIRVLLVDTNLREPSIHNVFGLSNDHGLSTVLSGDTEGQPVQPSGLNQLDILPAGPMTDNPSNLLNSPALTEAIVQLSRLYEMVIVDAAPVIPVVDGRIVAASCDASILVLHAKKTDAKIASQAVDGLLSVGAEILGVVVNSVSADRMQDGFEVSYAHLGGYLGEHASGKPFPERADGARNI
jgi:polysaccharide biosynthesis transport protein